MKIKIIAMLICTLFIVSSALPVTGNILKIDNKKVSNTCSTRDLNLDIAITNAFENKIRIFLGDGTGSFTDTGNYPVGNFPIGVTDGDFNSDGILDIATTDYYDYNVTLLLGEGSGSFINVGNYPVGIDPLGLISEDFDSDGNFDIAVANSGSNKISILLGNGAGGFSPQQTFTIGDGPVDLCKGLFNGDENIDIIGANIDSDSIGVLTGDGTGGFVLFQTIYLGEDYNPLAITNADFNKDGFMDVAVASSNYPYVGVLLGNGTGDFGPLQNFLVGYGIERFDIISEDFNGDGNPDIVVPNSDSDTISILLGDGSGGFQPHQTFDVGDYPVGICGGDFNFDGNCDVAVTNAFDNTISILIGNGTGGFGAQKVYSAGEGPVGILSGNFDHKPEADLECLGFFHWKKIKPGEQITDKFSIGNNGTKYSFLNWQIESYPDWGSWNFSETSGNLPEGEWKVIHVYVEAPMESKTDFSGKIKIVNLDNPSDTCEIDVILETPRSKNIFHVLLNLILERFPNCFPIIRWLLEI